MGKKPKYLERHIPIIKQDLFGNVLAIYKSVFEASEFEAIPVSSLYGYAKKEKGRKGVIFKYSEKRLNTPREPINLEGEIWKKIDGYNDKYQVSNKARIKSTHKGKIIILKQMKCLGYWVVDLNINCKRKMTRVHRLVAEAFIPNPENKPWINHIDGDPANNNINNLEWCTPSENNFHAYKINLRAKGEKHYLAKLTDNQVKEIRNKYNNENFSQASLVKLFSVSPATIHGIVKYKSR